MSIGRKRWLKGYARLGMLEHPQKNLLAHLRCKSCKELFDALGPNFAGHLLGDLGEVGKVVGDTLIEMP